MVMECRKNYLISVNSSVEVTGPQHQVLQCTDPIFLCFDSFWIDKDTAHGTHSPNIPVTIVCIFGACTLLTKATYFPCYDDDQVIFSKPWTCKTLSKSCHACRIEAHPRLRLLTEDTHFISGCGCSLPSSQMSSPNLGYIRIFLMLRLQISAEMMRQKESWSWLQEPFFTRHI